MRLHARALLLAALALGGVRAHAAPAEPSLMPELDAAPRRRVEKKAPAPLPAAPDPGDTGAVPYDDNPAHPPKRRLFEVEKPPRRPWIVTGARAWMTSGSVDTRYSIQVDPARVTPRGVVFNGETEERGGHGVMPVYSAEVAPFTFLSFEFQYGEEKPKGRYRDRYWVHAPDYSTLIYTPTGGTWHNPNHEDDLVLGSDAKSRRDWTAATMYLRLADAKINAPEALDLRHSLDLALGAERFRQNSRLTNLEVLSNSKKYYSGIDPGPIAGFDSTYEAVWQAPHFGLRESITTAGGFSLQALILYSPSAEFRGQGFNNFSSSGRAESPNFADWAHGHIFHFDVGMGWQWSVVRFEAGYQRLTFMGRNGRRRYYNADGSSTDVSLDFSRATLGGAYAGASLRF